MDWHNFASVETLSVVIPFCFFVLAGGVFSVMEIINPVRRQSRREGLAIDTLGLAVAWIASAIVIGWVERILSPWAIYRLDVSWLSAWERVALYVVLSDLFRFLTHRIMHSATFWPLHRFHHSVHVLDWYSGNRASVLHVALFMAPMVACAWLLSVGPAAVAANVVIMILWNQFMHTNARIAPGLQRALEWVVTTPRYHHIHHSEHPQYREANLGSVLTVWDRLWRTYVDPDRVDASRLRFGPGEAERTPLWRSLMGL